jgi:curli biogenesis system outer membrane secretion channel CsgG
MLFQLGFTNPKWEQTWDIAVGVTELVEEALHNSGRYRIIERRQIEQVLKEQGFGSSGSVDVATAAKAGRILGVQRLVMGSVSQFDLKTAGAVGLPGLGLGVYQAHVSLTGRVVDTSTAEIMTIVRGSGKADGVVVLAQLEGLTFGGGEFRHSVLGRALDQAIQDLVTKLNGSIGK